MAASCSQKPLWGERVGRHGPVSNLAQQGNGRVREWEGTVKYPTGVPDSEPSYLKGKKGCFPFSDLSQTFHSLSVQGDEFGTPPRWPPTPLLHSILWLFKCVPYISLTRLLKLDHTSSSIFRFLFSFVSFVTSWIDLLSVAVLKHHDLVLA